MRTWLVIGVAAAVTFGLRYVPMRTAERLRRHNRVRRLGDLMPGGIMVILVAWTLVDPGRSGPLWVWLASAALAGAAHLWRRNVLVTMVVGILAFAGLSLLV